MRSLLHQLRRAGPLIAGALALALLLLFAQPHQHAAGHPDRSDCVACAVSHQQSTPATPTTPVVAPLLIALAAAPAESHAEPRPAPLRELRAQGPPRA